MSRLEVGKMYTTKSGERIGPMKYEDDGLDYPFYAVDEDGKSTCYTTEGRYYTDGEESPNDIVFPPAAKWQLRYGESVVETFDSEDMAKLGRMIRAPKYYYVGDTMYTIEKVEE